MHSTNSANIFEIKQKHCQENEIRKSIGNPCWATATGTGTQPYTRTSQMTRTAFGTLLLS